MQVECVENRDVRRRISQSILRELPDWFGIPESTAEYVEKSSGMPFFACYHDGNAVGFVSIKQHSEHAAEIYVMGVASNYHRQGIGRALVENCVNWCRQNSIEFLQVKTLDGSNPDPFYARTREFYQAVGFRPLECFPALWDERNPCLVMVMPVQCMDGAMKMPTHIVSVGGLIFDGNGNVLLGRSVWRKQWEFFGGQVEVGENLEEALTREIKEETGITAKVISLVGVYSNIKPYVRMQDGMYIPTKLILDFICEYVSGTPQDSSETESVMWVPVARAVELVCNEPVKTRLENMLRYDGTVYYHAYETNPFVETLRRQF